MSSTILYLAFIIRTLFIIKNLFKNKEGDMSLIT